MRAGLPVGPLITSLRGAQVAVLVGVLVNVAVTLLVSETVGVEVGCVGVMVGVRVGVEVAVNVGGQPDTTFTTPVMNGWIVQWYGYEPGARLKVNEYDCVPVELGLAHRLVSLVALCKRASKFVQRTVEPTPTVTLGGRKAKL